MEAISQLVADSLARHGFDRPVDPRRLQWSRWSRCDTPHSLLVVPSKPGIFALAEEIMDLNPTAVPNQDSVFRVGESADAAGSSPEGTAFISPGRKSGVAAHMGTESRRDGTLSDSVAPKRLLAVLQFSEDDDMAFTLDRMFTCVNPMRARLATGRCFLRFVVIEDRAQRLSICTALNQWILNSAEKATGIPSDFSSSLELTTDRVGRTLPSASSGQALSDNADAIPKSAQAPPPTPGSLFSALNSGAAKNLHCPHPLPSGF